MLQVEGNVFHSYLYLEGYCLIDSGYRESTQ